MNLYCTADSINAKSGGGIVTFHESVALRSLGPCEVIGREQLPNCRDPWGWDELLEKELNFPEGLGGIGGLAPTRRVKLAHFYAGTFGRSVKWLKLNGAKVSYTIAAHDRAVSRREHEKLGVNFVEIYPHLCDESLWQRYIEGYRLADVIVCPSRVAERTVRAYGPEFEKKRIVVIPHGCDLPKMVVPLPQRFVCGYMGSYGCDKGVVYLMQAWKKLAYQDATLVLAGRDSVSVSVRQMWQQFGGGSVVFAGWQDDVSAFYDSISCYVQSSVTEGFGIEVLEALSFGRLVVCSDGAGAVDLVKSEPQISGDWVPAGNVEALAGRIDWHRRSYRPGGWVHGREIAEKYTWDKVRARYASLWKEMLA